MQFDLHPRKYRVVVCPGPLLRDGVEVAGVTHGRTILLCGTLRPDDRLEVLLDQLRRLRERYHGTLEPMAFASLAADIFFQLLAQGGPRAVARLRPRRPTGK